MHLSINDWIGIISFLVAIEMAIGHGTVVLTNAVPEKWIPIVQAWCNILAFVGASMVTALSRIAAVALVVVLGGALLAPGAALAAPKDGRIGGPVGDVLDKAGVKPIGGQPQGSNESGGGSTSNAGAGALLDKPFQDLANFIGDDISAAIALSTSIPTLQDGHGQQCLMALQIFGNVIKAHPAPLTFHIATDLESLRLKQMAANQLCGNPHCTQVFADLATTIQTAAPINFSIPIPSLHDLCAKIPMIAVVPAVISTTPAPPQP